ncbi:Putative transcription factor [Komagataella phaffii CBS 7435]|uniref:Zn(2)-C6 fungal-type domain-containing protein n=2 Tax=Komagataella phaffii TaxID=460519 RepID=C4R380_KOMPG|nr:Hypothetical protein PAS_c131_0002 [Komagataella phaffii GS115]AOA64129.1 GQ67_04283T0 [Komagataella phaffii]CAH2448939.1 Putative transcription factor [Komagataella phaffii CBS 7435]AOA68444.1 GQ68_04255T0 [Komagataella phaffii GS115]CAY71214.1 Hypothetical protein PAS_c131_0002 [Komagataella phaffii GS115]CCA38991.1 Putative transcription factor [Komagataella phaffii CBS 7435]
MEHRKLLDENEAKHSADNISFKRHSTRHDALLASMSSRSFVEEAARFEKDQERDTDRAQTNQHNEYRGAKNDRKVLSFDRNSGVDGKDHAEGSLHQPLQPTNSVEKTSNPCKERKRRRALSCQSCRKLKTRCDFELELGKCHRCAKLRLSCSLTQENETEIKAIRNTMKPETFNMDLRLEKMQIAIDELRTQLTSVLWKLENHAERLSPPMRRREESFIDTLNFTKNISWTEDYLDQFIEDSPLQIIKQIDHSLFKRVTRYDPLQLACEEFLKFYLENEKLCLELVKLYFEVAHFWIIPGGITEINREYVLEHPFITCVFVALAMCFDERYTYTSQQKQLYWLTSKLLGVVAITEPLTDHDIEGILYLCLYNVARKPKQPQLDGWLLSGIGIKHLMISFNFKEIVTRVEKEKKFEADDLYHLRIWNAMCAVHFQHSIGSGRPIMITNDFYSVHKLTIMYPKATIGDAIKVSELQLYLIFQRLFESPGWTKTFTHDDNAIFVFYDLDDWKTRWIALIDRDISGLLSFTYEFLYVVLSRRYIKLCTPKKSTITQVFRDSHRLPNLVYAFNTVTKFSMKILERLLKLPTTLIRGSPSFQWSQIIYASLSLFEFLPIMNQEQKSFSLNLISKVYWFLNEIGEGSNEATDSVGKILKNIVDKASKVSTPSQKHADFRTDELDEKDSESLSPTVNLYSHKIRNGSSAVDFQEQMLQAAIPTESVCKVPNLGLSPSHFSTNPEFPHEESSFEMPDLSQFDSFDEFFNGIFPEFKRVKNI